MKLELVSFPLCPFVQRSLITLKIKKAPFALTEIDLAHPPGWFLEKSPLGQVPILIVDDRTVLFESAVINEFLDETVGEPLAPRDPLQKAFERGWVEFGSSLLGSHYALAGEQDPKALESAVAELFSDLSHIEKKCSESGPCFRGREFGLVDAAWAPLFLRLRQSPRLWDSPEWKKLPRTRAWAEALVAMPAVRESVPADFEARYRDSLKRRGSLL